MLGAHFFIGTYPLDEILLEKITYILNDFNYQMVISKVELRTHIQ